MEGVIIGIVAGVLLVVVVLGVCFSKASSGNKFRENSSEIKEGMSKQEVISIMGDPSFTKTHQDGSTEFVYEKSEWKGVARGGTKTRRMEVVFSYDGKVISIGRNENCDKTGW